MLPIITCNHDICKNIIVLTYACTFLFFNLKMKGVHAYMFLLEFEGEWVVDWQGGREGERGEGGEGGRDGSIQKVKRVWMFKLVLIQKQLT